MAGYLIVPAVAALSTFFLTFVVLRVAPCIGAVCRPAGRQRPRKAHADARRRRRCSVGSSIAMAVASQIRQFHEMFDGTTEPLGLMLARRRIMFVVGGLDDLGADVSPPAKVAGMVLSGSVSRCSASRCSTSASRSPATTTWFCRPTWRRW